jgi:hypothetical protein
VTTGIIGRINKVRWKLLLMERMKHWEKLRLTAIDSQTLVSAPATNLTAWCTIDGNATLHGLAQWAQWRFCRDRRLRKIAWDLRRRYGLSYYLQTVEVTIFKSTLCVLISSTILHDFDSGSHDPHRWVLAPRSREARKFAFFIFSAKKIGSPMC